MALSAFKSNTKRGTNPSSTSSEQEKAPNRRSRSVSAVPRANGSVPSPSNLVVSDEFFNKRDNPLYGCSSSSSSSSSSPENPADGSLKEGCGRRGRSISRNSEVGSENSNEKKKLNRSLSTVDVGRRRQLRSVSIEQHYGNSETDIENRYKSTSLRSKEDGKSFTSKGKNKSDNTASDSDAKEQTRNLQTWTSRHPVSESWDVSRNWEDMISTSSFSEVEDAVTSTTFQRNDPSADVGSDAIYETVRSEVRRAVSEIRDDLENALWRNDITTPTTEDIIEIPPEFLNPDEYETDFRDEYVSKLEQAQERAKKLRVDLVVEELREQELSRIVNGIIHTPSNSDSDSQTSRPKQKASIERHKMSRRLAEEAMNYFDECVSISTIDSSDFSTFEEPQPSSIIGAFPRGSTRFFNDEGSSYSALDFANGHITHHELQELDNRTPCSLSVAESDLAISSSCSSSRPANLKHANNNNTDLVDYDRPRSGNFDLSFAQDRMKSDEVHNIRRYVKKFKKGPRSESSEHPNVISSYSPEDGDLSAKAENLAFDSLILRNRIESGGLVLCDIRIFS